MRTAHLPVVLALSAVDAFEVIAMDSSSVLRASRARPVATVSRASMPVRPSVLTRTMHLQHSSMAQHCSSPRMPLLLMRAIDADDSEEQELSASSGEPSSSYPSMQQGGASGQGTSIEKPQFGGGSGGTATLESSDFSVNTILKQLESIQQGTPKNIVILGTRHCSFLHQQIIELLSYALVLSDNHIFTSGAAGTHAAAIRGALRAENAELLTVILPQTLSRQPREIRELLGQVQHVIELGHDQLPLDAASRICNSELLSKGDQLIVFAFHDSKTLRETIEEAKAMSLLVTVLFLD